MPDKPLLIFPAPSTAARERKKTGFGTASYRFPDFSRQKDRLTPLFNSMQQSFVVDTADGLEPEYALVIETVGHIEDFHRAVRHVPGLEWLAEIDEETIVPDESFFQSCKINKTFFTKIESINKKQSIQIWESLRDNSFIDITGYLTDKDMAEFAQLIPAEYSEQNREVIRIIREEHAASLERALSGRLFLSMSNKQAIDKILSLWNRWDSKDKKLPRNFGIWTEIFKQTKTIRRWDTEDRLRDTGVIEYWKEELEIKRGTTSKITFEIELWYRKDEDKRQAAQTKISNLISAENGSVGAICKIDEIRFHAIKAELSPESIEKVLNSEYKDVFVCNDVMLFRPIGQCKAGMPSDGAERDFEPGNTTGDPIVAVLDGVPFANHALLQNRLILDDPDNFDNDDYPPNARKHGTAMASLVCNGEIDANEEPLQRPIYFRPIMRPDPNNIEPCENIPKEYFMEDLVERSVRRMFEGSNIEAAVATTIKIINLSIADSAKMFFNRLSSCARLLDWLSFKYKVLFCVSAGNIDDDYNLQISLDELRALSDDALLRHTTLKKHEDVRNRKLLSPAESINSISLGSIHADKSTWESIGNRLDILPNQNLPSPISAHGLGYKNSIKPELYIYGGRQLYDATDYNCYKVSKSGLAPGQCVAAPPTSGGEINRYVYTRGTSNSAALATRFAAQIYEMLILLTAENNIAIDEGNVSVILKTLLVHGATWGEGRNILESILKSGVNKNQFKKILARYLGFGMPDIQRVLECTSQRATAIGYGKIKKNEKHDFLFPLPPSLSGINERRRLTITLTWFSPVNSANRKYRKANLTISPPNDVIGVERINADGQQVKNGTVQHEVLEGRKVVFYQDGDFLKISVICIEDAPPLDEEVYYGLAVTLEVSESINLPIYEEIKDRISVPVQVEETV